MKNKYCIIMTTFSDKAVGQGIIDGLIKNRLAACIQAIEVNSFYHWKGAVNNDKEVLLFIKTKSSLYDEVESFIRKNHSYELPEIIKVPIEKGLPAYLDWINTECKNC